MLRLHSRTPAAIATLLVLGACNTASDQTGPGDDGVTSGPTDTGTPTTEETDTAWPAGDVGSLMVVQDQRGLGLYGLFVNQQPGYENLAYCAIAQDVPCVAGFPGVVDTFASFDPTLRFDPVFSQYAYVGDSVSLGPYVADLYYNQETGLAFYYGDVDAEGPVVGPVGVTFGVQWGDYVGTNDIALQDPIEVITPRRGAVLKTVNAQTIPIEWVPMLGGGDIHIFASTGDPSYTGEQWWVEDDGYFEVPIDDILQGGLDPDTVAFTVQRWNTATVTHHGNTLTIAQLTDTTFEAEYDYVGSRTELVVADNCAEAVNMTPIDQIGSYSYWGRMTGYDDDIEDNCGFGKLGTGLVRVNLPPLTSVAVEFNLPLGDNNAAPLLRDAAISITDDCNVAPCLAASNANLEYIPELTQYFNPSNTETKTVYIVLTGIGITQDIFWLDVVLEQLMDPNLADECLEAIQSAPLPAGSYYSEDVAFLDSLNPGLSCTNSQTPGPDAMAHVVLDPGQTLTASVTMLGADPAIYVMTNCTQPDRCVAGADASFGPFEAVGYMNQSAIAQENVYVVIDTKGGPMTPYFLDLQILP